MLTGTRVMSCACVVATEIIVKSGNARREVKPRIAIPWQNRNDGALYQTRRYGEAQRLHNLGGKGNVNTATCTICGKTKTL